MNQLLYSLKIMTIKRGLFHVPLFFFIGLFTTLLLSAGTSNQVVAQQILSQEANTKFAPAILPGKGLKQFDFFYAWEAKSRNMYIVRDGKITWSCTDTVGRGEISDAVLMKNGNILFAHQYRVTLINRDKKIIWNYNTPEGTKPTQPSL